MNKVMSSMMKKRKSLTMETLQLKVVSLIKQIYIAIKEKYDINSKSNNVNTKSVVNKDNKLKSAIKEVFLTESLTKLRSYIF